MLGCILVAFHAYHAYCIVLGIGISPGTGNEVRFVLRVTERVSIPSHRHSGLSMMELGFRWVFMCIHSILSNANRLLGHHASICGIGGTRIETCIHLWKYIAMPLSCSLLQQIKNQQSSGAWRAFQKKYCKTEANWGIPVDFRARQPRHASSIIWRRIKAVPGLHASLLLFLVNL